MSIHISKENITTDDVSGFFPGYHEVHVLRLDKIHPVISGNKWFKLSKYLEYAIQLKKKGILTFGGAWSNHIVAVAAAAAAMDLKSIGLIRGEEAEKLTATLIEARSAGMQLHFLSRDDYRQKKIPTGITVDDYILVNEGGYGAFGALGASAILDYVKGPYSHICCAVGTGTMIAGLINGSDPATEFIGISVLKNNLTLPSEIEALLIGIKHNWKIVHDYHFGGYAKHPIELINFMNRFYVDAHIPSDIVYTSKLFYAVKVMADKSLFPNNSRILLIHSGGLQGNASLRKGTLMF